MPIYKPPAAASPLLPTPPHAVPTVSPSPPAASPTPSCSNNLTFLEDASIPDGSLVQPQETLDKTWIVENSGTCNWDERYRLKLIAGPEMNVSPEQALYPARSGTQVPIRLVFVAPLDLGEYRSAWQAYSPDGQAFGDPIFIDVVVSTASNAP
ncbi:MAG: NBR1-Ig-like domain-containing protein [Anaerolineales bacterium]